MILTNPGNDVAVKRCLREYRYGWFRVLHYQRVLRVPGLFTLMVSKRKKTTRFRPSSSYTKRVLTKSTAPAQADCLDSSDESDSSDDDLNE